MTEPISTHLPYWPAALTQNQAAGYCGLSDDVFKLICPVQAIQFPGNSVERRYLRHRLDEWLSSLEVKKGSPTHRRDDDRRPFTPKMLAERWSCSERHIRNMINSGFIPALKWEGKLVRIRWEDVDRFESGQSQNGEVAERSSKALIKTTELTRLARLAKAENVTVELERAGMTIRIMPYNGAQPPEAEPFSDLEKWETTTLSPPNSKKQTANASPTPDKAVQKWYDSLGFDPRTMNDTDFKRLYDEAEAVRIKLIPSSAMLRTEESALRQLALYEMGTPVHRRKIKGCGAVTEEKLHARGFIELRMRLKFPDRVDSYILTPQGAEAARLLDEPAT
jgi:excisionase family DNA binding protein